MYYYVLVHIEGMDLQQNLLCRNIVVYDLCIGIQLQDHRYYQKHMDLGIDTQYRPDGFYNQYSKRTLVGIQS